MAAAIIHALTDNMCRCMVLYRHTDAVSMKQPAAEGRLHETGAGGGGGGYMREIGLLLHALHAAEVHSLKRSSQVAGLCMAKELAVPCQALSLCFTASLSPLQGSQR